MRTVCAAIAVVIFASMAACTPPARPSSAAAEPWKTVAAAPVSLTEVAVTAHGGLLWVAGGLLADGGASDEVLVFDPTSGTWAKGPRLPVGVHHSALVSTGADLLLVGGTTAAGPTAAVRRLDVAAGAWLGDVPLLEPRTAGAAAFDGERVVYAGGVGPVGVQSEVFALQGATWTRVGRLPKAREHLAATSDGDGRTFVLGGRVGGLTGNLATVDVVEGRAVRTLGDLPTPRGGVAAFWWPLLGACLAGGESPGGTNPQVECMRPDGSIAVLPDLGVARHGVGAAVIGGTAYVVLGGRQPGLFTSDVTEVLALP